MIDQKCTRVIYVPVSCIFSSSLSYHSSIITRGAKEVRPMRRWHSVRKSFIHPRVLVNPSITFNCIRTSNICAKHGLCYVCRGPWSLRGAFTRSRPARTRSPSLPEFRPPSPPRPQSDFLSGAPTTSGPPLPRRCPSRSASVSPHVPFLRPTDPTRM